MADPKDYLKTASVWAVLNLIVAEFQSDPTSVQCFDQRLVTRAIEVNREHQCGWDAEFLLRQACRHVLISIEAIAENWPEQRGILSTLQDDVAELRAAIAKADGT